MATSMTLVTGATGKIGSEVVRELVRVGSPVRALVRTRDARAAALEALGAEVRVGDLFDRASLQQAMTGADRAVYIAPFHPDAAQAAEHFAVAAEHAGVAHLVSLSQWIASPQHPSPLTRHHWFADHRLSEVPNATHTIVAPGYFADNYLRVIGFAAQLGILPSLTGDSQNAPPSNEDIARVIAGAARSPERWAGAHLRPTGPALLSTKEMAEILTEVLQRTVRRVELPLWMFFKAARMQGVSAFELSGLRHYVHDHRLGAFALGAPTNHVERVTGRPAESFIDIARRYAQRDDAQRALRRTARAWVDFLRTPLMPGLDPARYDRSIGLIAPPHAHYAMDDAAWRQQHTLLAA
jgi:uncharacterized protein YbjT (DUF2867 family)